MIQWYQQICPKCSAFNWINNGDPADGDCSKMDVTDYRCHACGTEVRMVDGEHGDQYAPHVVGTSHWDDFMQGAHAEGVANP